MVFETSQSIDSEPIILNEFSESSSSLNHKSTESISQCEMLDEKDSVLYQNTCVKEQLTSQSTDDSKYIASLDVGTTSVRCFIFNEKARIIADAREKVWLQ